MGALVMLRLQLMLVGIACEDLKGLAGTVLEGGLVARSANPLARIVSSLCQSRKAIPPVPINNKRGTSEAFKPAFDLTAARSASLWTGPGRGVETLQPER